MMKKLIYLSVAMLFASTLAAQPQNTITFPSSEIQYWVGTGSNSAVVVVAWDDIATPTALAWGVHWSGNVSALDLIDTIQYYDSRVSNGSTATVHGLTYNDGTLNLSSPTDWWCYYVNGDFAPVGYSEYVMSDGDIMELSADCNFSMTTATAATNPNGGQDVPADASIAASDIIYWVGSGSNEVVLAINWADTVLAWGYRFSGESVSIATVMDDIANADTRFSYTAPGGYLSDINFTEAGRTFGIAAGNYWWSLLNHVGGMGMADMLHDGDFYKWGDLSVAVIADSTWVPDWGGYWDYAYVWPYDINPVGQPIGMGPFCGAVGTEGCTAVRFDDSRIKGWATACTVVRGSQDLSNPDAPEVTYGSESDAVGAATASSMDVVSLGDGGSATLTFANPITNGTGYDFAVFENSFNDSFLELAFVEVSSDGQHFVRFPATSLTQTVRQIGGTGSVDPTYINNLAGKYRVGYGTPFDLDELRDSAGVDINNITHVRIVDVIGSIDPALGTRDALGNMINDPFPTVSYSAGFDLDGVAVMNEKSNGIDEVANASVSIYPNPVSDIMNITVDAAMSVQLIDMTGRSLMTVDLHSGTNKVSLDGIGRGIYLLRTPAGVYKVTKR